MKTQTYEMLLDGIMIGVLLMGIIWISLEYTSNSSVSYKRGFQDGQANVTQITCEGEYYAITTNWQYTDLITGNISYSKNYTKIGCVAK